MPGRDSAWRQGSLVNVEHARALGICDDAERHRVVLISHDCDLASDKEPQVEFVLADVIIAIDPAFAKARNVRRLHLSLTSGGGQVLALELRHEAKGNVATQAFDAIAVEPDAEFALAPEEKRALKQWLAARYGRPAFPNAFENRLRRQHKKKTVEQLLGKLLEPYNRHLVGVFFDLDAARGEELDDGDPYVLRIAIVYDALEGGRDARLAAEQVAAEIRNLFLTVFGEPADAKEIALDDCSAMADTLFSLSDMRRLDQWRVEYISLRAEPLGDFLGAGEAPA